jgi:hypothetical protein
MAFAGGHDIGQVDADRDGPGHPVRPGCARRRCRGCGRTIRPVAATSAALQLLSEMYNSFGRRSGQG